MSELLKEIEQQHNIKIMQDQVEEQEEQYEQSNDDNNDIANDLDDFERKIQQQKQKNNSDSDNSDSDSDGYNTEKKQKKVLFGGSSDMPPHRKPPSINKIQSTIMTQQKAQAQQNEDFQLQQVLNSGSDSLKDKKIRELVQRNRNLQVQYEREKALKVKMENQLNQVLKDNEETLRYREQQMGMGGNQNLSQFNQTNKSNGLGQIKKPPRSGNANRSYSNNFSETQSVMSEVADGDWQKKYQQVDKKLQEYRVNNQKLKNELNKALRVIAREIGDNFNIDKVLLEENSWKGRAQQIEKLKAKVRDLNQKLGTTSQMSGMTGMTEFGFGGLNNNKNDKTAAERRKEIEELKEKNQKLQEEYELLQNKFKASQSRKNNLEQEMKDFKSDYEKNKKILLNKSNADDQLIQALKQEYEKLKNKKTETRVIYQNRCEFDHSDQIIQQKEKNENISKIKILEEELKTKENMIQELINEKLQQDEQIMSGNYNNNKNNNQSQLQQQSQAVSKNNNQDSEQFEKRIQILQQEIKVLKKERNEFFSGQIEDKEARMIIKDLSMQNAKLRAKIDDLSQKQ